MWKWRIEISLALQLAGTWLTHSEKLGMYNANIGNSFSPGGPPNFVALLLDRASLSLPELAMAKIQ